jgi:CHRD domain
MLSIRRVWIPLAATALALTAISVQAQESQFSAKLTGASQLPEPTTSKATGELKLVISADGKKISYTLSVENMNNPSGADMHLGPDTANGPSVVKLFPVHGASPKKATSAACSRREPSRRATSRARCSDLRSRT